MEMEGGGVITNVYLHGIPLSPVESVILIDLDQDMIPDSQDPHSFMYDLENESYCEVSEFDFSELDDENPIKKILSKWEQVKQLQPICRRQNGNAKF